METYPTIANVVFSELMLSIDTVWGGSLCDHEETLHLHDRRVFRSRTGSGPFPGWGLDEPVGSLLVRVCQRVSGHTTSCPGAVVKLTPEQRMRVTPSLTRGAIMLLKLLSMNDVEHLVWSGFFGR